MAARPGVGVARPVAGQGPSTGVHEVAATAESIARDLAGWLRSRPSSRRTYRAMRVLHRATAGASSAAALAVLRSVPRNPDRFRSRMALDADWRAGAADLRRDGIAYLPALLPPEAIDRVRAFARTAPATLRRADGSTAYGTYERRDADVLNVSVVEEFVLAQPDVQRLIADPRVTEFAGRHFGVGSVVLPPLLYWSCVGTPQTGGISMALARRFHWDYDGVCGLRFHLYLTDVDEASAPMQYVAGSHRVGAYRTAELRRADLGIASGVVQQRFPAAAIRTMTGPAGTAFVSRSSGLHRGTDPVGADRLFLVLPVQATGFAGFQLSVRSVVPRATEFAAALADGRPELRMFRAAS